MDPSLMRLSFWLETYSSNPAVVGWIYGSERGVVSYYRPWRINFMIVTLSLTFIDEDSASN